LTLKRLVNCFENFEKNFRIFYTTRSINQIVKRTYGSPSIGG
jgi:hypothetical protein